MQFSIKKTIRAGFMLLLITTSWIISRNVIIMNILPFSQGEDELRHEKIAKKVMTPGGVSRTILKKRFLRSGTYDGILATYGGYLAISNYDGTITFPRKHAEPEVKIIITPTIKPIFMLNNIIHHWELLPGQESAVYNVNLLKDPTTELYYWNVASGKLPNNRIPLDSIVIFAKPKNIIVPEGVTLTPKGGSLLLPPMYATKELNRQVAAATVEDFRIFLEPIKMISQEKPDVKYVSDLITNP